MGGIFMFYETILYEEVGLLEDSNLGTNQRKGIAQQKWDIGLGGKAKKVAAASSIWPFGFLRQFTFPTPVLLL